MQGDMRYPEHFIRFLGTAGTRFIMLSQRRASGGIWFSYGGSRGVIDPGPGSLVQICAAVPPLSAVDINTLILTHRHIDHSSDLNVLAEGMTLRAHARRGHVLLTADSTDERDSVLLKYVAGRIKKISRHEDGVRTPIAGSATVESVVHLHHGVECYGLIFRHATLPTWGVISDSMALPHFPERYRECSLVVINVTLPFPWARLDHMSAPDVASLLQVMRPETAILTHMGNKLLDMGPDHVASMVSNGYTKVIAATDGMIVDLQNFDSVRRL